MKLIQKGLPYKVNYFGIVLPIEFNYGYIATDSWGEVGWYENKPEYYSTSYFWHNPTLGDHEVLCEVALEGMDWKDTLCKVESILC